MMSSGDPSLIWFYLKEKGRWLLTTLILNVSVELAGPDRGIIGDPGCTRIT